MSSNGRPAESSTCKPLILVLGSAVAGILFAAESIIIPGYLASKVIVVGDLVTLPQQETFIVNITIVLFVLILLFPLLHALCVRRYTLLFK